MIDNPDRIDLIEITAAERTNNIKLNELELMYYNIQCDSLEKYSKKELYLMYVDLGLNKLEKE